MSFLINPFAFLAAGGDFESIATVTVGSGGARRLSSRHTPGTYQHLQVRMLGRSDHASTNENVRVQLNARHCISNYAHHALYGRWIISAYAAEASSHRK
jgi:hypothetical protein